MFIIVVFVYDTDRLGTVYLRPRFKTELNPKTVANKIVPTGNSLSFLGAQFPYFWKSNLGEGI